MSENASTSVAPIAKYLGYSSHDCESHYRCPLCYRDFGSWSTTFYKKNYREHCKCPNCGSELLIGY